MHDDSRPIQRETLYDLRCVEQNRAARRLRIPCKLECRLRSASVCVRETRRAEEYIRRTYDETTDSRWAITV